jgi:hypothetical protein
MQLTDIYLGLGEDRFGELMRSISLGRLKTFQLFDRIKTRLHVSKLNTDILKKVSPRSWQRMQEGDIDFATEIGQAILISHMDMIQAVLNHLGIPHQEGFFEKDADIAKYLKDGWREEVWEKFRTDYPKAPLVFYINHLAWEMTKSEEVFAPAA